MIYGTFQRLLGGNRDNLGIIFSYLSIKIYVVTRAREIDKCQSVRQFSK